MQYLCRIINWFLTCENEFVETYDADIDVTVSRFRFFGGYLTYNRYQHDIFAVDFTEEEGAGEEYENVPDL